MAGDRAYGKLKGIRYGSLGVMDIKFAREPGIERNSI